MSSSFNEIYVRQFFHSFFNVISIEITANQETQSADITCLKISVSEEIIELTLNLISGFNFPEKKGKMSKIIQENLKKCEKFIAHFKRFYSRVF